MEEEKYRGHTIKIEQDDIGGDYNDPRSWDNIGKMICFHSRYGLGDKHDYKNMEEFYSDITGLDEGDYDEYEEYQTGVGEKMDEMDQKDIFMLDLYLYDHSGLTISTAPFSCPWDSGQIGFIYVTKEKLKEEGLEDKTKEEIYDYLRSEVKTYDNYLRGDIYGFTIEETEDSCWGYFGWNHEESGLLAEAKSTIDWSITEKRKKKVKQIKTWIKNKVPFQYRIFI